ncbi:peptidase domain-containing ABC transporter [Thiohalorhabdus sp.]|uniref:peptidase domain-containing ABC transporter n=1 Tax=Thiohalorhabdus sp. TaxID=3094134 RepID=UPI002FC303CC
MDQPDHHLSRQDFFWALASAAHLNRIPFDADLALERFPPPYGRAELESALADYGIEASLVTAGKAGPEVTQVPCLVLFRAEPESSAEEVGQGDGGPVAGEADGAEAAPANRGPPVRPAIITGLSEGTLTYFTPDSDEAQHLPSGEFHQRFDARIVVLRAAEEDIDDDPAAETQRPFGFRWFIPELLRHKPIWRDILLASLFIQILGLATPLFTQVIIDKVIVHQALNTLGVIAVGLFMFMAFSSVMTWVRQYLIIHTGNRIDAVLGSKVLAHLFELPMRYFEHRPTGTLVARIEGMQTIREFLTGAAVALFLDLPFLFVFLAVMVYYSLWLTLIVVTILALIAIISLAITPALRRRLNRQFLLGARNQAFVTEYISGMETVKSLQMEPQLNRRYGDYLSSYLDSTFRARTLGNTYNVAANSLEQLMTLAVLTIGAYTVMQRPDFTVGMLVAFNMFASRLSQPVLRLVSLWQEFQQADIAVKRLGDIMDAPREPYRAVPARTQDHKGGIGIEGLAFRYDDDQPLLYEDLDVQIPAGTCAAVKGPSGTGKSTLAKLLLGFYRPSAGRIRIDGHDIRHLAANELRALFGVVPQETVLFAGTVHDNLTAGNPSATFEQAVAAARMAGIHETIEALPEGYQTELGEHGTGLSGGQRQRLAIARALLKQPRILIFDEATSHLDAETAEQVARTVNDLKGKVTILFITHALPKALAVDRTVRLDGGGGAEVAEKAGKGHSQQAAGPDPATVTGGF